MKTVQYIGRRPFTDDDRDHYTLGLDVEAWGAGVRVTLSDGNTVHEFPDWTLLSEGRQSSGEYSYALSGTGELHIVERFFAAGSMEAELNNREPSCSIVQTYSAHAWRNATGRVSDGH